MFIHRKYKVNWKKVLNLKFAVDLFEYPFVVQNILMTENKQN